MHIENRPPLAVNSRGASPAAKCFFSTVSEWLVIVAVFFVVGGAPAPHVNETHYLTKAKHYWDASYCPGDLFLDSADPHLSFYWTFGWLTRVATLPVTAWIGRVVAWGLLALAWLRLSRVVLGIPWAAALSAALWVTLVEVANFAGEWVVGGIEAKCFAYVLVVLGLTAMCRGNWKTPWILLGAAAAFHVLVGAWAVLAGLGVWLTEPRESRPRFISLLPGLLIGGVLSLAGLLPALALERGTSAETSAEAAQIYVFDRLPHHLAPLSLPDAELARRLVRFGALCAAFMLLWIWSRRQTNVASQQAERTVDGEQRADLNRVFRFAAFALVANVVGLVLEAALRDHPLTAARILRYYWFRQADVVVPLAAALAGTKWISTLLKRPSPWAKVAAALPLVGCCWFLVATSLTRASNPVPPATARLDRVEDWQDACAWIKEHAPADARFLVPRMGHSFKWYAARADVANYKDVPQDAESVVAWRKRCADVFPTVEIDGQPTTLNFPDQLGVQRVRELARKYGATHVIARRYPPLDMKVVYPEQSQRSECFYTVYETGESAAAESP